MKNILSNDEILEEVKKTYSICGKVTIKTLRKYSNTSYDTVKRRFGSISVALEMCGLKCQQGQRKMVSKQEITKEILRLNKEYGYVSKPIFEKHSAYSPKIVQRIFGSFANMYEELNLERPMNGYVASDEELLLELDRLHQEQGIVTTKIIKDFGKFSVTTYMERFGSVNNAYELCQLPRRNSGDSSMATYTINKFGKYLNETPKFEKTFDWLRNPATNRKLPIDGYFPKANIAIEYNGPQHYKIDTMYTPTIEALEHRKYLDKIKYEMIKNHGIKLIVVHYKDIVNEEYILKHIL